MVSKIYGRRLSCVGNLDQTMKKTFFILMFSLSACATPAVYSPKEKATFWGLFGACQVAEGFDAAQTYHGISTDPTLREGQPWRDIPGYKAHDAAFVVNTSILTQVVIDASGLWLYFAGKKSSDKARKARLYTADGIMGACAAGHTWGAITW